MDRHQSSGTPTPEELTEAAMLLFDSNMPLDEMRVRIEELFRRAIQSGVMTRELQDPR